MNLQNYIPREISIRLTDEGFVSSTRCLGIRLQQTEWKLSDSLAEDETLVPRTSRRIDSGDGAEEPFYDHEDEP